MTLAVVARGCDLFEIWRAGEGAVVVHGSLGPLVKPRTTLFAFGKFTPVSVLGKEKCDGHRAVIHMTMPTKYTKLNAPDVIA